MRRRMIQKVTLNSHKIAYDKVNALILVEKLVKLGSGRANFKVTLLERPPQKSCSTSKKLYEDGAVSVKKLYFKRVQSESCAINLSTQASKSSKQLQRSQAVRASKETQTKAKRASMCASKACRVKPRASHS